MRHSDYQTLIDRGRKAGLKTTDLYSALTSRPPELGDQLDGQNDGNGFVRAVDRQGQSVFRPSADQ
jgi:hypothetical protein